MKSWKSSPNLRDILEIVHQSIPPLDESSFKGILIASSPFSRPFYLCPWSRGCLDVVLFPWFLSLPQTNSHPPLVKLLAYQLLQYHQAPSSSFPLFGPWKSLVLKFFFYYITVQWGGGSNLRSPCRRSRSVPTGSRAIGLVLDYCCLITHALFKIDIKFSIIWFYERFTSNSIKGKYERICNITILNIIFFLFKSWIKL